MTPDQMRLVRMSYAAVRSHKAHAGDIFYRHLFAAAPELRPMFSTDMRVQQGKFVEMIGIIVSLLHSPAELSHTLSQLAHRHRAYGTRDEHYDKVGDALLRTLEDVLGDTFTPALRAAWRDLYNMVASAMKRWSPSAAGE